MSVDDGDQVVVVADVNSDSEEVVGGADDGDQVVNADDRSPLESAAAAGTSGADSDGDGIADAVDRCPREPEAKDGFERAQRELIRRGLV